ncbi:MAG: ThuA domain-containing protein, partial [Bacteroidetes bacterium]|nr:ThuA domain-containing protein [Bacteroidota bacterium]
MVKLFIASLAISLAAFKPAPKFHVLVLASRASDHQKMIAAARPFFEQLAATNNLELDFSDDTSLINPANLSRYQVFVMLHLAPFDMSASQQSALQQFVESGKGWVGIHAAGLTGKSFLGPNSKAQYWQWFENLMGDITYSPHPAFQQATLVIEDPRHPATLHLPARMQVPDEWYEFNKSPRDKVHVLASVDESSYHQNKPMGDHPIIWTNERYRRMIYIGIGHDPILLKDTNYATLLRDAILWAGSGTPPPIPTKGGKITYEKPLPSTPPRSGIDSFKINPGYDIRFTWTISNNTLQLNNFFEKPLKPGTTNDWSKIEYRWFDFRRGHPWSPEDSILFSELDRNARNYTPPIATTSASPRFRVLAIYENGGHHIEYSRRAKTWLNQLAADSNFAIDYSTHADTMTEALLKNYQLIIQLDFAPYGWKPETQTAFKKYIEEGRGGWIGFHHATLLGEFDNFPMWPWFSDFMGGIRWKNYIARFASATVHIEDHSHPVLKGIPDTFTIKKEEWYTYDKSPRPNVHVLANVDESSYRPDTTIKMGDHPVIWTNEKMPARNIYIFMGHSPILFDDPVYCKLFSNAIFWAAATKPAARSTANPAAYSAATPQ